MFDFQLFLFFGSSSHQHHLLKSELHSGSHTHTPTPVHTCIHQCALQANFNSYRSGKSPHETPKACAKFIRLSLKAEPVFLLSLFGFPGAWWIFMPLAPSLNMNINKTAIRIESDWSCDAYADIKRSVDLKWCQGYACTKKTQQICRRT